MGPFDEVFLRLLNSPTLPRKYRSFLRKYDKWYSCCRT